MASRQGAPYPPVHGHPCPLRTASEHHAFLYMTGRCAIAVEAGIRPSSWGCSHLGYHRHPARIEYPRATISHLGEARFPRSRLRSVGHRPWERLRHLPRCPRRVARCLFSDPHRACHPGSRLVGHPPACTALRRHHPPRHPVWYPTRHRLHGGRDAPLQLRRATRQSGRSPRPVTDPRRPGHLQRPAGVRPRTGPHCRPLTPRKLASPRTRVVKQDRPRDLASSAALARDRPHPQPDSQIQTG